MPKSTLPTYVERSLQNLLAEVALTFTEDCKLTLIVRKPNNDESDVVVTNDKFSEISKLIKRRSKKESQNAKPASAGG